MKKILSILMLVVMLFSFAAAEDDAITFTPTLLNAMEFTAEEWWSSYTYQTAFAVIAAAELTDYEQQNIYASAKEGILNDAIYVSIDDEHTILTAFFFGDEQVIGVMYMPVLGLSMLLVEAIPADMAATVMDTLEDEYVKIEQADFVTLLETLAGD